MSSDQEFFAKEIYILGENNRWSIWPTLKGKWPFPESDAISDQ